MKLANKKVLALMLLMSPVMNNAYADEAALTQRIERLEKIIQGQGLITLLGRVDQLQSDVQRLHGDNETLRHELEQLKKSQRQQYLDLDQRINEPTPVIADSPAPQPRIESANQTAQQGVDSTIVAATAQESDISPTLNAPVAVESGEAAYQSALQILRSGQYQQAITELEAFPAQYPGSRYLPNAYYWQGEANYVLRNFELAITAFQTVIKKFPASTKVADATLKLGFSQYELGQLEEAKSTLQEVMEQFPSTTAARLAKIRLERIQKQSQ
jgi:tol-pal system protein YbgF